MCIFEAKFTYFLSKSEICGEVAATSSCCEVVVSEGQQIQRPVKLIKYPVKGVGTANLVVKLSVTRKYIRKTVQSQLPCPLQT